MLHNGPVLENLADSWEPVLVLILSKSETNSQVLPDYRVPVRRRWTPTSAKHRHWVGSVDMDSESLR